MRFFKSNSHCRTSSFSGSKSRVLVGNSTVSLATLWKFNISMQNGPFLDDLFIAMSVDQRVPATCASMYGWFSQREMFTIDFLMVFPWSSMFFHVFPMVFGVVFHGKSNDFPMTSPTWSRLGRLWCLEEHAGRRGWRAQRLGLRGFGLGMSGDGQDAQLKNSIDANLLLDAPFKSQKWKD